VGVALGAHLEEPRRRGAGDDVKDLSLPLQLELGEGGPRGRLLGAVVVVVIVFGFGGGFGWPAGGRRGPGRRGSRSVLNLLPARGVERDEPRLLRCRGRSELPRGVKYEVAVACERASAVSYSLLE